MSTLLSLAQWAHALRIEHVPDAILERLRYQAASTLAAAAAGTRSDDVVPAVKQARRWGPGRLRVAPGIDNLGLDGALLAGATLSMAQEFDDWLVCGQTSHSAVWAAWLGAAELGSNWDRTLTAQLAANEILARIGGFCLGGRQNGPSWAFLHAVGGALVGGLLRGQTPEQLASGMGLALAQAHHVDHSLLQGPGKAYAASRALIEGWRTAELVSDGLVGPIALLDADSEFITVFTQGRPVRGWFAGLPADDPAASAWFTSTLAIKCVPGCLYLTAAVEAMQALLVEAGQRLGKDLKVDDILRVDVDCGAVTAAMERRVGKTDAITPASVTFSVRKALAVLLVAGELGPIQLHQEWLDEHEENIEAALAVVRLHQDARLTLAPWQALRGTGVAKLLTELGPGPLVAAVGAGGTLEAGLSLTELPLMMAGERLQNTPTEDLPALFGRGLSRLTEVAARGLERLLPAPTPYPAGAPTLDAEALLETRVAFPARVRVLLHGGQVLHSEVEVPRGASADPETREAVRRKLWDALLLAEPQTEARHADLVHALLGAANAQGAPPPLPDGGPAALVGS